MIQLRGRKRRTSWGLSRHPMVCRYFYHHRKCGGKAGKCAESYDIGDGAVLGMFIAKNIQLFFK